MTLASLSSVQVADGQPVSLTFSEGTRAEYNLFWLRDNCPSSFHPQTGERKFDLLSMPDAPTILSAQIYRAYRALVRLTRYVDRGEFDSRLRMLAR